MKKLRNVAEKVKEVIKIHYGIGDEDLAMWASSIIIPCFYVFTGIMIAFILILINLGNIDVSNIHFRAIENLSLLDMVCISIFAAPAALIMFLCGTYKDFDHMFIAEQCDFFSRLSLRSYPLYVILTDVLHVIAFTFLIELAFIPFSKLLILYNFFDNICDLLIKLRYLFFTLTGIFFFLYCIIALILPTKQEKQEEEYFFDDDEDFFDDDEDFFDDDEDFFDEDDFPL